MTPPLRWALIAVNALLILFLAAGLAKRLSAPSTSLHDGSSVSAPDKPAPPPDEERAARRRDDKDLLEGTGLSVKAAPVPPVSAGRKAWNIPFQYKSARPRTVYLVGDFNKWRVGTTAMTRGADHIWRARVKLSEGTYGYKFVVDGKWIRDPANPRWERDGHGGKKSVIAVSASKFR